jgi:hypothetical protein
LEVEGGVTVLKAITRESNHFRALKKLFGEYKNKPKSRVRARGWFRAGAVICFSALIQTTIIGFTSAQMMTLPGKFDVAASGAATYTILLSVPSGTAGMTPSLEIEYNSQAGNGLLGVGWSLSGLLSIGRCPLGAQMLNQLTATLQFSNASGAATLSTPSNASAPYRISVSQRVAASFDLDGSVIPPLTTTYQYDAFGDAKQVVASTPDGYSKTTNSTYSNDATRWYLGRLTGATVTSTTP